jgi:Transglutaminase-like superfamily
VRRFHPANLRAAWWAFRTASRTRRLLAERGLDAAVAPPPPPALPVQAGRGVRAVLRRGRESCLVNSIVLQAWEAAHGCSRDLVIGITGPDGFRAHAWLEGEAVANDAATAASEVGSNGARRRFAAAPEQASTIGQDERNPTPYVELLRRPSPRYERS